MTEKLSARQQRRKRREQWLHACSKNPRQNLLARPGAHGFINVLDHLKAGCSVARIFRCAEICFARKAQLVNIRPFGPSSTKAVAHVVDGSSIAITQART